MLLPPRKASIYKKISSLLMIFLISLYTLGTLHTDQVVKSVHGAGYGVKTGYYIGNGRRLSITGLGFQPDLVIIKSDTANTAAVFKTSVMPVKNMAYFSATVDNRELLMISMKKK